MRCHRGVHPINLKAAASAAMLLAFLAGCALPDSSASSLREGTPRLSETVPPSPTVFSGTPASNGDPARPWPTVDWALSTPEDQGMDSAMLGDMIAHGRDEEFGFNSILVIRHGYLVAEGYFSPSRAASAQPLFSVTKSVISILIGRALEDGYLRSVDQPVLEFFPETAPESPDARKSRMTIAHLLTMTSGLDWGEIAPYQNDNLSEMNASPHWVKYVLDRPMAHEPGEVFCYSSGVSHVLSAILARATGMSTLAYAQKRLFAPLGITEVSWRTDPQGVHVGGWGLSLTPRDMAKLGYLYLRRGVWDETRVIPNAWVEVSTRRHVAAAGLLEGWGYGYQWWVIPGLSDSVFEARGHLGQHIMVVPGRDLVVVITSRTETGDVPIELLERFILPSVFSDVPLPPNPEAASRLNSLLQAIAAPR